MQEVILIVEETGTMGSAYYGWSISKCCAVICVKWLVVMNLEILKLDSLLPLNTGEQNQTLQWRTSQHIWQ